MVQCVYTGWLKKLSCCTVSTAYFFEPPIHILCLLSKVSRNLITWLLGSRDIQRRSLRLSSEYATDYIKLHHYIRPKRRGGLTACFYDHIYLPIRQTQTEKYRYIQRDTTIGHYQTLSRRLTHLQ